MVANRAFYFYNYYLNFVDGGEQEVYGIKNMGAVNPHNEDQYTGSLYRYLRQSGSIKTHKMVTPKAIKNENPYDLPVREEIFDENNNNMIQTVTGNYGNIIINNIINKSGLENPYALSVCCGIGNTIQLQKGFGIESNVGTTTLNYISNYGYGGIIGVVGIKDLLLNMGTINIDIIEQNSPVNFEVKKNKPSTVGIYNCVQNGFSCLNLQ